ncbi:MAG: polysaccharide biosynthesis tyrosine autokinase [Actinomycetes bacterium]
MEPMQDRTETNIGEYVAVLRRRWMVIAGTMILVLAIVAALDFSETPIYEASSQLLLQPKQSESIFSPAQSGVDPTRAVQNELKIINSLAVRTAVAKAYGEKISISAASGGDDDVIILSATDSSPKEAARKVNVYAETYQTERFNAIVDDLTQSKLVLQQQIDDFQKEIDSINKPLAALDAKLAATSTTDPTYADLTAERERVNQQIQAKRGDMESQLSDYQQRLQVLQLSERLTTTGGVQILNPATVPSSPISPNVIRDLAQAALIGFFLGVGLALLLEQVDDSIRTVGDLERSAKGVPTLGLIPLDDGWKNKDEPRLSTQAAPMSATAEAYRSLRTTLQYLGLHRPMGIVQITSASAHEGKTSTVANLAIAFAEAGMPVAIVGCDLRRPRTHTFLKVDGSLGLTSVLLGEVPLEVALQQSPVHPNIRVLASGPRPPNPSELLSLDRTSELIRSLLDNHSIVFLDCPPVLPVSDALVLSRCVDASLFIAKSASTSKREVKRALERLNQVNNPLVGTILNGVDAEGAYGSLYDYYGYSTRHPRSRFLPKFFKREVADVPKLDPSQLSGVNDQAASWPAGTDDNDSDHVPDAAPTSS